MQAPTDKENDELAAAFRVFDRTGQGIIPADEFANQAKILGEGLTDLEAAELLKYSQDGKLQYKGALDASTLFPVRAENSLPLCCRPRQNCSPRWCRHRSKPCPPTGPVPSGTLPPTPRPLTPMRLRSGLLRL